MPNALQQVTNLCLAYKFSVASFVLVAPGITRLDSFAAMLHLN